MRLIPAILLSGLAAGPAFAAEPPIRIEVIRDGASCPVTIDGRKIDPGPAYDREVQLRLVHLRRPNRTFAVISGERSLPYRCLGNAMRAVERAGLRYRLAVPGSDSTT